MARNASSSHQTLPNLSQQVNELSLKNRALESVFENVPYIMMLVNHEGRVININRMGARFANRNKDELLGLLGGQVFSCLNSFYGEGCGKNAPCASCPVRTRVNYTLQTGEPIYEGEGQLEIEQNGAKIIFDLRISTTLVESGAERQVLVTIADNTQHKRDDEVSRQRASYLSAIIENQPGLLWLKDVEGQFLAVNTGFSRSCGLDSPEALVGKTDLEIWPLELAVKYRADDAQVIESKTPCTVEEPIADRGQIKWFETFKAPILDEHGQVIGTTGYSRDITNRKQAEAELQHYLSELQVLYDNGLAISALREPREIGQKSIETLSGNLAWHHLAIRLLREGTNKLELIAFKQPNMSELEAAEYIKKLNTLISETTQGLSGWSVVTGRAIRLGNVNEDSHYIETYPGIHSGMYMPLLVADRPIGCISVESEEEDAFTEQDERFLTTLARQTAIAFENARLYQSIQQELKERQQAEQALRESEERFRALFSNSIDGVALHEIVLSEAGEPVDYIFLMVNPGFEKHTGLQHDQILGKRVTEVYPGIEKTGLIKTYGRVALTGEPVSFETHLEFTGQFFKITAYQVGKGRFAAVFEDITGRKRTEESLRQMNERFALATRAADLGVWDWDIQKDELVWDEKMYALYGLGKADFGGAYQAWLNGVHPDDRERCDKAIGLALIGAKEYDIEFQVKWPSGVIRYLKAYGNVTRTPDGTPLHMVGVNFDITESKQAEEEREMTVRLLQLLNSKSDLGELMRSVTELLQEWSGCEAVGIRLREKDDFPYFETRGFPPAFVELERHLCVHDLKGQLLRDTNGNPFLECMCGNVICGRFNASKPFFTSKGSFWTNCTTELLASTTEADRQARTRNRCNGEGYESVALIPLRAGDRTFGLLQLNDYQRDRFTPAKIALFERLADSLSIALLQRQIQMALSESEYFFKESQRVGFIGSYKTDFVKGYWESSEILDQIFGIDQDYDRCIQGWLDIVHPDDRERMEKYLEEEVIGKHKRFDAEYRIVRQLDHAVRWVHGFGEVGFDNQGNIISMIGTIQDTTERKLAEDALRTSLAEKEILLKEVHHRVKNNLASINGLIELQQETLSDPAVVSELNELGGRIHSMALVHELLYQSESLSRIDLNHYFEMLTAHIRTSYERSSRIHLHIDANGVEMDLDNAIPCGLIVNELVTNSFKYAFPDGKTGLGQDTCEVSVSAKRDNDTYVLTVSDNGAGFPPAFDWKTSQSLGLQLVMLLSQRQLKGQVELVSNAGVSFRLRFIPKHNISRSLNN